MPSSNLRLTACTVNRDGTSDEGTDDECKICVTSSDTQGLEKGRRVKLQKFVQQTKSRMTKGGRVITGDGISCVSMTAVVRRGSSDNLPRHHDQPYPLESLICSWRENVPTSASTVARHALAVHGMKGELSFVLESVARPSNKQGESLQAISHPETRASLGQAS